MKKNINTVFIVIFLLATYQVYPMQIFVKSYIDSVLDRTYTLEVEPTEDIINVRSNLATRTGYPLSAHYQLFFGNTLLADGYTLGDYNIVRESILKLYLNSAELPVELISFTANISKELVVLKWHTATEVNNYGFEIERSVGSSQWSVGSSQNVEWEKIGFVEGHGNSNSPHEYSFTDKTSTKGKIIYRLKQIDIDGQYEYSPNVEVNFDVPTEFSVKQNYPNPFNPATVISYSVAENSFITLKVYDVLGNEVSDLVNEIKEPGNYSISFDASKLSSGIYFYTLKANGYSLTKKMLLAK